MKLEHSLIIHQLDARIVLASVTLSRRLTPAFLNHVCGRSDLCACNSGKFFLISDTPLLCKVLTKYSQRTCWTLFSAFVFPIQPIRRSFSLSYSAALQVTTTITGHLSSPPINTIANNTRQAKIHSDHCLSRTLILPVIVPRLSSSDLSSDFTSFNSNPTPVT